MFLVVGLGSMGKRRVRNLHALGQDNVIGFDPRADRREEANAKYNIPCFDNFEEALAQKPRGVIVSTPPDWHLHYAQKAIASGLPCFTEAGTDHTGWAELYETAQAKGVQLVPSCTMRFHPSIQQIHSLLQANRIGKIVNFVHHCGHYLPDWHPWEDYRTFYVSKRETGACREIVPFELTWLLWLIQDMPESVMAYKDQLLDLDIDIDDIYNLALRCENGPLGYLQVDVIARAPTRALRLLGTDGQIEWSASERKVRLYDAAAKTWEEFAEPEPEISAGYNLLSVEGMYVAEIKAFLEAIAGDAAFPHNWPAALKILNVLHAAEMSAESGERISTASTWDKNHAATVQTKIQRQA